MDLKRGSDVVWGKQCVTVGAFVASSKSAKKQVKCVSPIDQYTLNDLILTAGPWLFPFS